ncbi:centrosomal protein CEP57L1 [Cuculus canorus]|uniref:centrosomal protein CEP57L1 n=1 Tax=Cuculus canorus TaxID=55661 RepID=UPI0023AA68CE|nr:centrosomal protein CEP57L1 [Cuculus canorus]
MGNSFCCLSRCADDEWLLQGKRSSPVAVSSESKNGFIGSFLQPPDKMLPAAFASIESKKLAAVGGDRLSLLNNQAVKTLQEKIRCLELEKSQAEDNLCCLSIAAAQYKKTLEHESCKKDIAHQELMQQRKDVNVQLNEAQSRCSLLDKQLDYMRKMISSAELEKKMVLGQQAQLQKEEDQNQLELHAKLEKLEMLEKMCLKLGATQRIIEDKIKHLEEKLCKEEHQQMLIQDKTAQLQTRFEINRILMSSVTSENKPKKENGKKKTKKKNTTMKKMDPSQLHVKAGELPFVAGKSVSSSHSVRANVQSVLHIMKHCNPRISSRSQGGATSGISGCSALSESVFSCSTPPTATRNLSDLQDELGQMSFKHHELLKKIQETQDSKVCEDLERELDCLVKQIEIKGEQISKLKNHQATMQKLKRKTQKLKPGAAHIKLKHGDQKEAKEIAVPIRERMSKSCPGQRSRNSLQLLKNVQKLQSTLKKLLWEQ